MLCLQFKSNIEAVIDICEAECLLQTMEKKVMTKH